MNQNRLHQLIETAKIINTAKTEDTRHNHVSFLLRGNRIVCAGVNTNKTHPRTKQHPYHSHSGIHAEMSVVIRFGKFVLSDYTLVVMRLRKDGTLANSKPCEGCQSLLSQLSIGDVWYSTGEKNEFNSMVV